VLGTLPSATREELDRVLTGVSRGLEGPGAAGTALGRYWTPAYRDGAVVLDALRGQRPDDLPAIERNLTVTARALAGRPERLGRLLDGLAGTATALGQDQGALQQTVRRLDVTLRTGTPALASLRDGTPALRRWPAVSLRRSWPPATPRNERLRG
jgi:hypothetical protein